MSFKRSLRDFRGFTLVELLVVIGIIAVLSTILLLQFGTARAKARDVKRIGDVNQIRTAVEQYFDDSGSYPAEGLATAAITKYFSSSKVPLDPLTGKNYFYAWYPATNPTKYQIRAELESKNANALGSDSDINSSSNWSGEFGDYSVVATENCATYAGVSGTTDTTIDCAYDLGLK